MKSNLLNQENEKYQQKLEQLEAIYKSANLTDAEKTAHSWLDVDDAALGKVVKNIALTIVSGANNDDGQMLIGINAALLILCGTAADSNAATMDLKLGGLTFKGEHQGDWRVVVKRVNEAPRIKLKKQPIDGFKLPALAKAVASNVTTTLKVK